MFVDGEDIGSRPPNTYEASRVKRKYFSSKPAGWPTLIFVKTF
jgi:hypothetical protein